MTNPSVPLEITCQQVYEKQQQNEPFLLLDCREPDEYETVQIEGSLLLPMSEIQARVSELKPYQNQEIVVHCHHGGRSLKVTLWLRGQGYTQAVNMAGGIDQWAQEIDPSLPRY